MATLHYAVVLPIAGGLLAAAGLALHAAGRRGPAGLAARAGLALLALGWPVYMLPFALLDYRLAEVARTASDDLSPALRLAAAWSSGGNSLYLYTALFAAAVLYAARGRLWARLYPAAAALALLLLASAALNGAFDVYPEGVGGFGINPLLKSPWVYPHPLTTFGGYSLLLAGSLAALAGGGARAHAVLLAGWGLLSYGILLGAVWSYETIGWGGYWAWDPVEVAELAVWLSATAALHALGPLAPARRGLLYLTASSALLAPYVTRSGLSPLHSFAPADLGSAALIAGASTLLALAIAGLAQVDWRGLAARLRGAGPAEASIAYAGLAIVAMAFFVYASLYVPAVLSAAGVEARPPSMDAGVRFYHPVLYPLFAFALLWLPGYFLAHRLGARGLRLLHYATLAGAAAAAVAGYAGYAPLAPDAPPATRARAAAAAVIAGVALASLAASVALAARRPAWRAVRDALVRLVHVGVALAFIGVLASGYYAYEDSLFSTVVLRPGEPVALGPVTVELVGFEYKPHPGGVDLYHHTAGTVTPALLAWTALHDASRTLSPTLASALEAPKLIEGNETLAAAAEIALARPQPAGGTVYDVEARVVLVNASDSRPIEDLGMAEVRLDLSNATVQAFLAGGSLTLALAGVGLDPGFDVGDSVIVRLELAGPLRLAVAGYEVEVRTVAVEPRLGAALVEEGTLEGGGWEAPLPLPLPEGVYLYLKAERGELGALRALLESPAAGLLADPGLVEEAAGINPRAMAIPSRALAGVSLVLELRVSGDGWERLERVELRFEANGEASGIRGLVTPALIVRDGLVDVYINPQPPMVSGYYGVYHELIVYYLAEALPRLPPEEALALAALMAGGYTAAEALAGDAAVTVQRALMDLLILAYSFDPADSAASQGILVRYKLVPGTVVVWAGGALAATPPLLLAALQAARARAGGG